jgi:predicted nucleotidyltransferase
MKICGVELKGNEAIIVSLSFDGDEYTVINKEVKKIKLNDTDSQEDVQSFTKEMYAFLDAAVFDGIAIKGRAKKGKFAGGSVSFKIEGIIQNGKYPVSIFPGATIKAKLKNTEIDSSEVNGYQVEALRAAVCYMVTQ